MNNLAVGDKVYQRGRLAPLLVIDIDLSHRKALVRYWHNPEVPACWLSLDDLVYLPGIQ